MTVKIKLEKGVNLPAYATDGSAAVDLVANIKAPFTIAAGEVAKIPTGVRVDMTEHPGVCALLLPRSGLGSKGLVLANTVGLIDNDYQGEIVVMAFNRNGPKQAGMGFKTGESVTITPGMRLAQLMFTRFEPVEFEQVEAFAVETERGENGFGSTGA
ncbi:MAG: dUTP diphosphatase [Rhodobacterales bacterium]|nr:dUTP diphosphatase [Rhodobacterales bacterium]